MVLVIDNYDSFTYNLVQYIGELGSDVRVVRNDDVSVDDAEAMRPDRLVISPGPATPSEAGISVPLIVRLAGRIPILGVCLGHQSIGQAFGAEVVRNWRFVHGKVSSIRHDGEGVFKGCPNPVQATRYHSLVVRAETLPDCLVVTARTDEGEVMGLRHRSWPIEGVQFHPESIMTPEGKRMIANFLEM